ncbi:MAG: hypothetical protein R3B46_06360 [Phycisphaerales bacterium]
MADLECQDDAHVDVTTRVVNLIAVTLPIIGLFAAFILLWGVAFDWVYLMILGVMYVLTGLGITVGYHRYFTHRSFKTSALLRRPSRRWARWRSRGRFSSGRGSSQPPSALGP